MSRLPDLMELYRLDPDDADLHFMIAQEHANEGRPQEALHWLQRYVSSGSDVGAGYRLAATCHVSLGDVHGARAALTAGVDAALAGGHPTLAQEMREELADLDD